MRLISPQSPTAEQLDCWGALAERAAEPNPFFEPLFLPSAVAALGGDGVRLLVAERDGAWIGCLPVQLHRRLGISLLTSTWKHPYAFLGTPLADRDHVEEFAAALSGSLGAEAGRCLLLRRCSDGPVMAALKARIGDADGCTLIFDETAERGAYRRRPPDEHLSWMKSRRRSELKRQRRKLGEQLGEEVVAVDREDTEQAVEDFLALEASGWKGDRGTALASDEGSTDLFRQICRSFAAAGRLRIRGLQAGEQPLAMTCDLSAGDTLFGFKSAYDEGLRRFSPGVQLQADNFADFDRERSEALFDSCAEPGSTTVEGLWPDRRPIATIGIGPTGLRGRLLGRAFEAARRRRAGRAASADSPPGSR